jgi:hypothetical protein
MEGILIMSIIIIGLCIYKIYGWYQKRDFIVQLQYLGGHPNLKGPRLITVEDAGDRLFIGKLPLLKTDISEVKLIPSTSVGSAAGGAIIGALLAGPLGAVAGASLSGKIPKDSSLIQLTWNNSDTTFDLFFSGPDTINVFPKLKQFIIK